MFIFFILRKRFIFLTNLRIEVIYSIVQNLKHRFVLYKIPTAI